MNSSKFLSEKAALSLAIFIAGLCSIIYELLISTTTSYFLGDSIRQFSLTIGIYMAAMGFGSFLSKFFLDIHLMTFFIIVEALLGIIGGGSVPILYYAFDELSRTNYTLLMILLTTIIGTLTGMEIPLLARIMKKYYPLRVNLANVLSLDYFGALGATLLFPFLLLPFFGVFQTSVFFGLINVALGLFILWYFSEHLRPQTARVLTVTSMLIIISFGLMLYWARPILETWDHRAYPHKVVFSIQTPYQKLALTRNKSEIRLYINRIIQFSSADEYRYHESLGLLPLQTAKYHERVLVLGGGEGLLVRELLKEPGVKKMTVVDLDAEVFRLARENPYLSQLNEGALDDPRVETVPLDAAVYLQDTEEYYDLIIADLPDPSNEAVARLYSTYFFQLIREKLTPNGIFATQASSPYHTRDAFWCIVETVKASGFDWVVPYHTYVPSFGDWGFIMAAQQEKTIPPYTPKYPAKYLEAEVVQQMFHFAKDSDQPTGLAPNRIDRPTLLEYYLADWQKWSREQMR